MKRKDFLAATGALTMAPLLSGFSHSSDTPKDSNQFIELIKYQLHVGVKQKLVSDFYKDIAIPALNRIGVANVGVFTMLYGPNSPSLYIIIPHGSFEAVYSDNEKLLQDKTYMTDGDKFLNAPLNDTAFIRMEKTILRAFNSLPTIEIPMDILNNPNRIYEIRIYESPNAIAAKKKIQIFNEGGEIAIFKNTGLRPVLFGETIACAAMPNLQYMLVFNSMEERDKNWGLFVNSDGWNKLKQDPYYADTVSNITDIILKPTAFSQI